MTAKNKSGAVYLETLGHKLNAAGEIDLVALVSDAMEGPLVVSGGWRDRPAHGRIRGAGLSPGEAVRPVHGEGRGRDLLEPGHERHLGLQRPGHRDHPGRSEPGQPHRRDGGGPHLSAIESAAAAYALSDLGEYRLGDTVTLLLGRNGAVAAVTGTPSGTGSAAYTSQRIGVVTAIERAQYSDGKGGTLHLPHRRGPGHRRPDLSL